MKFEIQIYFFIVLLIKFQRENLCSEKKTTLKLVIKKKFYLKTQMLVLYKVKWPFLLFP